MWLGDRAFAWHALGLSQVQYPSTHNQNKTLNLLTQSAYEHQAGIFQTVLHVFSWSGPLEQ